MERTHSLNAVLDTVQEACKLSGIPFGKMGKRLKELVGKDTIVDYYVSTGPFPAREDVLLDVFVLSPVCLYNLDIRRSATLCHRLFLSQLELIEARPERGGEGRGLYIVYYLCVGTHSIMIREKVGRQDDVEKFCSNIKDATVAIRQPK